jgi:hypothetical protein
VERELDSRHVIGVRKWVTTGRLAQVRGIFKMMMMIMTIMMMTTTATTVGTAVEIK